MIKRTKKLVCLLRTQRESSKIIRQIKKIIEPVKTRLLIYEKPLISVVIHNYNYGKYLDQCLQSVILQRYKNYEICISDNNSSDNSWKVIKKYKKRFPQKISAIRHSQNYGPQKNVQTAFCLMKGDLFINLCSDDYLMPECFNKVFHVFSHYKVGFVMYERIIVNDTNKKSFAQPFYNKSAIIPGHQQAAVFMMSGVNPSISQICYNIKCMPANPALNPLSRWWGSRITDFEICLKFPIAYLKESLLAHRVHQRSDSSKNTKNNLLEIMGMYLLNYYFLDKTGNQKTFQITFNKAIIKIGNLALRYAAKSIMQNNKNVASRYYNLARSISPFQLNQKNEKLIKKALKETSYKTRKKLSEDDLLTRKVSYEPPIGSIEIKT